MEKLLHGDTTATDFAGQQIQFATKLALQKGPGLRITRAEIHHSQPPRPGLLHLLSMALLYGGKSADQGLRCSRRVPLHQGIIALRSNGAGNSQLAERLMVLKRLAM